MNARLTGVILGVGTGVLGLVALSAPALAQDAGTDSGPTNPSCTDTTMFPNPIFLVGSTAFEPVAQAMAVQLANRTAGKVSLLYGQQGGGSCTGVAAIKDNSDLSTTAVAHYYVTAAGAAGRLNCTMPAGIKADVGISDVFYETCGIGTRPAGIADLIGPVQAMLIIVPASASSAVPTSITAEEAADVWGCGMRGQVSPWIVENSIQQRNQASGTQNIIARSINVLASAFHGTINASGGNMITSVGTPAGGTADSTIGFLAADAYDTANPPNMRALAFRGFEQTLAYYANSAPDTFDKRNTRDGHYLPWGYEHMIVRVDTATGKATTQQAQNFVDWVLNNTTTTDNAPNFDPIQLQSSAHVIPTCAMKVKRASDGGFLSAYAPTDTCNCAFEAAATGAAPAACVPCTGDTACTAAGTHCHHGFCE